MSRDGAECVLAGKSLWTQGRHSRKKFRRLVANHFRRVLRGIHGVAGIPQQGTAKTNPNSEMCKGIINHLFQQSRYSSFLPRILDSPDIQICEMISRGTQRRAWEAGRPAMVHVDSYHA